MTQEKEKKIQRSERPPAVEKTVAAHAQTGSLRLSREKENGQVFYEAELTVNGHSKDVLIDSTGVMVEVEEQVAIDSLPSAVRAGLHASCGKGGKLLKVESLTKHNQLVAYETKVRIEAKSSKVQVGPDGKPLDQKE